MKYLLPNTIMAHFSYFVVSTYNVQTQLVPSIYYILLVQILNLDRFIFYLSRRIGHLVRCKYLIHHKFPTKKPLQCIAVPIWTLATSKSNSNIHVFQVRGYYYRSSDAGRVLFTSKRIWLILESK